MAAEEKRPPGRAGGDLWAQNRRKILVAGAISGAAQAPASPRVNPYVTPFTDGRHAAEDEPAAQARRLVAADYLLFFLGAYVCCSVPLLAALAARDQDGDNEAQFFVAHAVIDAVFALEIVARVALDRRRPGVVAAAAVKPEQQGRRGRRTSAPMDPAVHVSRATMRRIRSVVLQRESLVGLVPPAETAHESYLRSSCLLFDVASVLPLDYAALAAGVDRRWLALYRLNRLLRLRRVFSFVWFFRVRRLRLSLVRLLKTVVAIAFIVHYATCMWLVVSLLEGFAQRNALEQDSTPSLYLLAFFWAFQSIVKSPADFSVPDLAALRFEQTFLSMSAMLVGVLTTVLLVGHVSSLIASFDEVSNRFFERVERVNQLCEHRRLPAELRERMVAFLEFSHGQHAADREVLAELSTAIRKDVSLHLCSRMVSRVPFFTDCEPGFLYSLILLLRPQLCAPRDVLIWQGERPPGMWFVGSGQLTVLQAVADGGGYSVVAELSAGSFFGEMALLSQNKAGATVEATAFCELYFLSRDDFDGVLTHYPHVLAKMQAIVVQRQMDLDSRGGSGGGGGRRESSLARGALGAAAAPVQPAATVSSIETQLRAMRDDVMGALGRVEARLG